MKVSKKGIDLIKEYEGCYLKAYQDSVGVWTIGYGITNADRSITGKTIKRGLTISKETAEKWLEESLDKKYLPLVMKYNKKYNWNQNELDAMVSFCYNIGSINGLTANGTRSKAVIANKMLEYKKAGGVTLRGLERRRKAERKLFITPVEKTGYSGTLPKLPPRGYYQTGDGYKTLKDYKSQIKKVQKLLNWITDSDIKVDGLYGDNTAKLASSAQKIFDLPVNGKFGTKILGKAKKYKK